MKSPSTTPTLFNVQSEPEIFRPALYIASLRPNGTSYMLTYAGRGIERNDAPGFLLQQRPRQAHAITGHQAELPSQVVDTHRQALCH